MITRIIKRFNDNIDNINLSLDKLAPKIAQGAEKIVSALLSENKILVCGNEAADLLAQYTVTKFIHQFETQRPALPAVHIPPQILINQTTEASFNELFSQQIQALGKEKDILLLFLAEELDNNCINAIQTAHDQAMQVILICGETSEDISPYIDASDLLVQFDIQNKSQIMELQLLSIHCLCDLIDHLLFGTP